MRRGGEEVYGNGLDQLAMLESHVDHAQCLLYIRSFVHNRFVHVVIVWS